MNPEAGAVRNTAIIAELVIKMHLAMLATLQVLVNLWAAWHIG